MILLLIRSYYIYNASQFHHEFDQNFNPCLTSIRKFKEIIPKRLNKLTKEMITWISDTFNHLQNDNTKTSVDACTVIKQNLIILLGFDIMGNAYINEDYDISKFKADRSIVMIFSYFRRNCRLK